MINLSTSDTSCVIYNDYVEPKALDTIRQVIDSGAFRNSPIRIMPDVHEGKGIVIGFTAPLTHFVNPNHVGVDIGCCIDVFRTNIKASQLTQEDLLTIERRCRNEIPFGKTMHEKSIADTREFLRFLNAYVAKCASTWHLIEPRTYTEADMEKFCNRVGVGPNVFWKSLGTVGGGNHYIEFGQDDEDHFYYSIHCGSRHPGLKIAEHHAKRTDSTKTGEYKRLLHEAVVKGKEAGGGEHIEQAVEEFKRQWAETHIDGYLTGDLMRQYLNDMVVGMAYALFNHELISRSVQSILKRTYNQLEIEDHVQSVHNYIDMEDHMIRKGAIRAYKDERIVVPFNMRDGLAVCRGLGNPEWNYSCAHGAGRRLSRSSAKRELDVALFSQQMQGIVSSSVGYATLDEAPDAYKDTEEIKRLIGETCVIEYLVRPLINLKATD